MPDFSPLSTLKRMASGAQSATPGTLGRFELRRLLGQGAQSKVWLAFDPRLEREVAIKLMKPMRDSDTSGLTQWLAEARTVSRLTHPNIVPVFEADVQDQQPYLVFEYVAGQTMTQLLASQGARPAAHAVALMVDVLGALVAAHAAGVVHRDLKPSNVIVDASGRARVMDFGIAQRISSDASSTSAGIAGTPAYMAPEAARGAPVSPVMDVYSAGLMLAELLWGKPLQPDQDAYRAIYRAAYQNLALPQALLERLDDALKAVMLRALNPSAEQRYPSSAVFLAALQAWQTQQGAAPASADAATGQNSTLEFLLRRMRNKTDFPALSDSVVRIQSMATSEKESISSITNQILKDVALTNKLLRLVNSAHYARGNSIGTVSRAVQLVGFNGIRNMALSLVLLEHMQDKSSAHLLKEEFLRGLMAGSMAAELASNSDEGEEAFIGALFQNLGRMLTQFYFPEEAAGIRALVHAQQHAVTEEVASIRVLGMSFEALGIGVARAWGLPESIQRCMQLPAGDPPSRVPSDVIGRLRWVARAANDMTDAMVQTDPEQVQTALDASAKNFNKVLGMSISQVTAATTTARKKLVDLADAMDLRVRKHSPAAQLLLDPVQAGESQAENGQNPSDVLFASELQATQTTATKVRSPASSDGKLTPAEVAQTLTAGIQDITNAMVEEFKLSDVLRMILEAMFRALAFHRIVFCMRDPKTDTLTGRFGLGAGVEGVVKSFSVPLSGVAVPDLFATICAKGADTLISDTSDPRLVSRLPAWYRKFFNAPTFLILPLVLKGRPFGLIYADMAEIGGLTLDEKELALLRTLRNQAVMAFRQSQSS
ncbi:MAG: serine/threonine protein kinase [Comamonadaceae bacterium]|nr:MAG: serine/threonine protein kinase [Comamonadaceae bacterium]